MPKFGKASLAQLGTCHEDLIQVFEAVVEVFDCKILEGARNLERQQLLYESGKSKLQWPESKHNTARGRRPFSHAVDAVPWPIDWKDRERMTLFAGYVQGIANARGVRLRWGGDWDSDFVVKDNVFDDLAHFELA